MDSGDQDRLVLDGPGHHSVDGVAKRVLEGGDAGGHSSVGGPGIVLGNDHVLCESAIYVHSQNSSVDAHVALPAQALAALAANDMRFRGDELTDLPIRHPVSQLDDGAAELMADDAGRLDSRCGPGIPRVNVKVGSAYRGRLEFYLDVAALDLGFRGFDDLHARLGAHLRNRFHRGDSVPAKRSERMD